MIRTTTVLLALAVCVPAAARADPTAPVAPTVAVTQEPTVEIRPGPGKEAVETNCNPCHSLDYIRTNAGFLSAEGWKAELAKMRGPFGAPIDDKTAETILQYLVANYGIARQPAPAPAAKKEKREPR